MAAIRRRSLLSQVGVSATLATADDVDGTSDGATTTQSLNVSGAQGAIIIQIASGTAGTAGIDVLEESNDGGGSWHACGTLLAASANPHTGTVVADAALNAAGVEPTGAAVFKAGPFSGPTLLRIGRKTTNTLGTTWVTGAPAVIACRIG